MKRWVIKNELGDLAIVSTSGFEPVGSLCEAQDGWASDEITHNDGIVFLDLKKVSKKAEDKRRREIRFNVQRHTSKFNRYKKPVMRIVKIVFLIALGFGLATVWFLKFF